MKKLFSKAKSALKDSHSLSFPEQTPEQQQQQLSQLPPSITQSSTISPPTATDLFRHRYHHGTNLGSIFTLEQWLSPAFFPANSTGSTSELSAAKASIASIGVAATRVKWEAHWAAALSDHDLSWLVNEANCTSVRLPLGYYCLGGEFCVGTPFEDVKAVYEGAWMAIRTLVRRAREFGVGTLLDVHALPGGANGEAHGGAEGGKAKLWGSKKDRERATRAMMFIAREVAGGMEGVVGLQIVNEAAWAAEGMYAWYEDVLRKVGEIDATLPIYVSDAWDLGACVEWARKRKGGNPVVVDTHKYYTFSEEHRNQSPGQLIAKLPYELGELDGKEGGLTDNGAVQVIIGEYSCVMDGRTWEKVRPEEREGLVKQFGMAQSQKWQQRAGGAYFWTFQDGMGEWSFIEQTRKGNIIAPPSLLLPTAEVKKRADYAQNQRQVLADDARRSHEDYWNGTSPGQYFEHDRYSDGWQVGFSDALSFFTMRADGGLGSDSGGRGGGDKIGCLEMWVKKRLCESGQEGQFVWEWEQGIRAGIAVFNSTVGI